jgi:hypothetical protein
MKKLLAVVHLSASLLLSISPAAHADVHGLLAENGSERLLLQQKQRQAARANAVELAEDGADRVLEQQRKRAFEQPSPRIGGRWRRAT